MGANLLLISTVIAFVVSFLWLRHIYHLDIHQKEDKWLLAKIFFIGCLSAIPAGFLNSSMGAIGGMLLMMVMVGFIEEGVKYGAVKLSACKNKDFDEPLDGILFAGTAALGFAFVENIDYNFIGLTREEGTGDMLLMRTMTPFLHMMLSGIWGAYLGLYKMGHISKSKFYLFLIYMALAHSVYDLMATILPEDFSTFFVVLSLLGLATLFYRKVDELNHISPYKNCQKNEFKVLKYCASCGNAHHSNDKFCKHCGSEILSSDKNPISR